MKRHRSLTPAEARRFANALLRTNRQTDVGSFGGWLEHGDGEVFCTFLACAGEAPYREGTVRNPRARLWGFVETPGPKHPLP